MTHSLTRLSALFALLLLTLTGQAQMLTQADFTGVIVPQYAGSGTATRLPVVYRATVSNLTPNTLYRYFNQAGISTDLGGMNSGAGNPLLLTPGATPALSTVTYVTSASLTVAGGYGTFTTNATGSYTGWFAFLNTGNSRFTAGNALTPNIVLAPDATPTVVEKRLALDQSLTVLALGTGSTANDATGLRGSSLATPRNLVAVYDNVAGTGRPLSVTIVEPNGAGGATVASLPGYYTTASGDWNTLIPNVLPNGVRRIEQRALVDGSIVGCATSATGTYASGVNTVNPASGSATTALSLTATDAPLNVGCGTAPAGSITATPATLPAFTTPQGTPSATQSFTVNGTGLTAGLVVTAPAGYEVSLTATTGFTTNVSFTQTAGTAGGTVYVRLTGAATGTFGGNITVSSLGNTDALVAVTGTVTSTGPAGPVITTISPNMAPAGGTTFLLTITGTGLATGATVNFGGTVLTATTVNAAGTSLTVMVPAAAIATAGTLQVTVTNPMGGGTSAAATFTVNPASTTAFFEDFEMGAKPSYAVATAMLRTGDWTFDNALITTSATADKFNGVQGARIRGGGFIAMNFDKPNGAGVVTINAAIYGTEMGVSMLPEISSDGGMTYTPLTSLPIVITNTLTAYTYTVNRTGNVRLRISSTNLTAGSNPRINIDDITITDATAPTSPTLTVTPTTLPAFTAVVGAPSAAQSFSVSGVLLTAGATVTAPAGYEVSLSAATGYAATITVPQTGGTLAATTVYVRLTGAATGPFMGNVAVTSTGASAQNVAVTGTVTATAPLTPTITSFTPTTALAGATVTITGTNLTGATALTVGGVAVTGFTVVSGMTITFTLPATAVSGPITVTTPGGTATSTGTLTVTPAVLTPTLVAINPVRVVVGGPAFVLNITGTNFTATSQVSFNGATYTAATVNGTGTAITVNIPASAITMVAQVPVTVANGTSPASNVRDFFIVAAATTVSYEDFELGKKTSYAAGNDTLRSGIWTFSNALTGDQFNDRVNQTKSARIRNGGFIAMNFDKPTGAGVVTFQAALYGTDAASSVTLEYSTDAGTTYTAATATGGVPALSTTLTTYSYVVNQSGNVRLRISNPSTTAGARINVDDVTIADYMGSATRASQALPGLALYPNPAHDRLTVRLTTAGPATVALRDLTGRVVLAPAALAPSGALALPAALPAGVYLLEVTQNGTRAVRRITKE